MFNGIGTSLTLPLINQIDKVQPTYTKLIEKSIYNLYNYFQSKCNVIALNCSWCYGE